MKQSLTELMAEAQPILDDAGVMHIDRDDVRQVCALLFRLGDEGDERATALAVQIGKVEDMQDIMAYGVMSTPAVVIDGKVVHAGGVPDAAAVASWLRH